MLDGFGLLTVTGSTSFSGTPTLDGLEFSARDVSLASGATVNALNFPTLTVNGNLTLGAGARLNLGDANDGADLTVSGVAPTIGGTGEIVLSETGGSTISANATSIAADVTIRGPGAIRASAISPATNGGKITSDVSGEFLFLDAVNNFALPGSHPIEGINGGSIQYEDARNLGRISVTGGGDLVTVNIDNDGILEINGGTLRLAGNWSNDPVIGLISATDATIEVRSNITPFTFADLGTVIRTNAEFVVAPGATLNNTGQTLDLDNSSGAKGSWTLRGGTLQGGTVQTSNGASLLIPGSNAGTLDNVTLKSSPVMGNSSSLFIRNGLTLGGITIDLSVGGTGTAKLTFSGAGSQHPGSGNRVIFDGDSQPTALLRSITRKMRLPLSRRQAS